MNVEVNVKDRTLKPVKDVSAGIVDPTKMSHYFTSRGSGPMKPGATVEWEFADVGAKLSVDGKGIEENRKVTFDWTASGVKAQVTIVLEQTIPTRPSPRSTKPDGQWMVKVCDEPWAKIGCSEGAGHLRAGANQND